MKQNMQSLIELKFNWCAIIIYTETIQHTNLRENSRGIYMQAKGDYLDWVYSDQMVLGIVK